MRRERALKVVLVLVGLLFLAGIYPLMTTVRSAWQANNEDSTPMMLSLYVTLGVFLVLAARNPSAHRSLIAFTAWSSFAHAAVMSAMAVHVTSAREGLLMVGALLGVIGIALIVLAPAKQPLDQASVTAA
jgi:hypothetical protein